MKNKCVQHLVSFGILDFENLTSSIDLDTTKLLCNVLAFNNDLLLISHFEAFVILPESCSESFNELRFQLQRFLLRYLSIFLNLSIQITKMESQKKRVAFELSFYNFNIHPQLLVNLTLFIVEFLRQFAKTSDVLMNF